MFTLVCVQIMISVYHQNAMAYIYQSVLLLIMFAYYVCNSLCYHDIMINDCLMFSTLFCLDAMHRSLICSWITNLFSIDICFLKYGIVGQIMKILYEKILSPYNLHCVIMNLKTNCCFSGFYL